MIQKANNNEEEIVEEEMSQESATKEQEPTVEQLNEAKNMIEDLEK